MNWSIDSHTQQAARLVPLPIKATSPAAQFAGKRFVVTRWSHRAINQHWPAASFIASPTTIIDTFKQGDYLEALAMVMSWGGMGRTSPYVYRSYGLSFISDALDRAASKITATRTLKEGWDILTGDGLSDLGWSPVISSKVLHFLCRSLGFTKHPPVAIDNAVILQSVWPKWKKLLPAGTVPCSWGGRQFDGYLRYMTAVLEWASLREWTTTEMESTIFNEY